MHWHAGYNYPRLGSSDGGHGPLDDVSGLPELLLGDHQGRSEADDVTVRVLGQDSVVPQGQTQFQGGPFWNEIGYVVIEGNHTPKCG